MEFHPDCHLVVALVRLPLEEQAEEHVLLAVVIPSSSALPIMRAVRWEAHVDRVAVIAYSLLSGTRVIEERIADGASVEGPEPDEESHAAMRLCVLEGVDRYLHHVLHGWNLGVLIDARDYVDWQALKAAGVPVLSSEDVP